MIAIFNKFRNMNNFINNKKLIVYFYGGVKVISEKYFYYEVFFDTCS